MSVCIVPLSVNYTICWSVVPLLFFPNLKKKKKPNSCRRALADLKNSNGQSLSNREKQNEDRQ